MTGRSDPMRPPPPRDAPGRTHFRWNILTQSDDPEPNHDGMFSYTRLRDALQNDCPGLIRKIKAMEDKNKIKSGGPFQIKKGLREFCN